MTRAQALGPIAIGMVALAAWHVWTDHAAPFYGPVMCITGAAMALGVHWLFDEKGDDQ